MLVRVALAFCVTIAVAGIVQARDICYISRVVADGNGVRIHFTRGLLFARNGNRDFRGSDDGTLYEVDRSTSSFRLVDGLPAVVNDKIFASGGVHDNCRLTIAVVDGVVGVQVEASSIPNGYPEARAESFIPATPATR